MESETIQYIQKALQDRLVALGFTELSERTVSHEGKAFTEYGITLEQAERWIWKEHNILIFVYSCAVSYTEWYARAYHYPGKLNQTDGEIGVQKAYIYHTDPFSARLAGVERVIEILEQQSKREG